MAAKALKIDSLDLDLENPRITLASDQRDAMQKILDEQKVKLINLAESIAIRGFSPMDRCLVLRSHLRLGKFIVLEGNRRVLCAKLLKNSSLIQSLTMTDSFRKRLLKASSKFALKNIEPVDCFEVQDRAEGNDWIRQRHRGEDSARLIYGVQLGSMLQYYSPLPLNITTGATTIQGTAARPTVNGAFIERNAGIGNDLFTIGARLSRAFTLTDRVKMEAIAEAFNALNHRNNLIRNGAFGAGAYPSSPAATFGQITAVNDARSLQFALRFRF